MGAGACNTTIYSYSPLPPQYGNFNSFLGTDAGYTNTKGSNNTFTGTGAGYSNFDGNGNTFTGSDAGFNSAGNANTFVGAETGRTDTSGSFNTFVGNSAGYDNSRGCNNTFLGFNAGEYNKTGNANTAIGYSAGVPIRPKLSSPIMNTTAVGAYSLVTKSNSLVLGSIVGINGAIASTNVGIGTTAPRSTLDVTATDAVIVPVGTTAQRPSLPVQGMIRFNTTTGKFEGYDGSAWQNLN